MVYSIIHHVTKGGKCLAVHHCPRETTSLDSFHCHQQTFIPGMFASAVNSEAYLLDVIMKGNTFRTQVAFLPLSCSLHDPALRTSQPRTYDIQLMSLVNNPNRQDFEKVLVDCSPSKSTLERR